jgi:FkbM family methyltransferase
MNINSYYSDYEIKHIKDAEEILRITNSWFSNELRLLLNSDVLSREDQESFIDLLRDSAVELERIDLKLSYELMSLARRKRPNGTFIVKKHQYLHELLEASTSGKCDLNGLQMEFGVNPPYELLKALVSGQYEQNEVNLLKLFLERDEIVLEVGAGIGYMGISASISGLCKSYTAFEANPSLIPFIIKNMETNNVTFDVTNAVLLDHDNIVPFFVTPAFWASSLIEPFEDDYVKFEIKAKNKNCVIKSLKPTMLIVDIEGGEWGFFDALDVTSVQKIILEIHPAVLSDKQLNEIYSFLIGEGFILNFKVSKNNVLYWYK